MCASERRYEIMKILHHRRYEKIENLAFEFGVSERTVRRDIEILSLNQPIYTQPGRYGGGVYLINDILYNKKFLNKEESKTLNKVIESAEKYSASNLSQNEISVLKNIISKYA